MSFGRIYSRYRADSSTIAIGLRVWVTIAGASILAVTLMLPSVADACSGCGCRGGPGYRGPNGKCVSWAQIGKICGSPPTEKCTPEGPNVGADEAAAEGAKIEQLRDQAKPENSPPAPTIGPAAPSP